MSIPPLFSCNDAAIRGELEEEPMLKRTLSALLALCLLCLCLGAAAEQPALTDMTGRVIALQQPAQRIVALTAANVEILYAIGAGDLLVGRGEYCNYPAECLELPVVNSGADTNIEQILALQPDIVIMDTMAQTVDQVEALENAGVRVAVTKEAGIQGVYEAISLIAALTGRTDEGAELIAGMQAAFAALQPVGEGKTIYFEVSPLQWGLWTAGTGTFMDEIAGMLGLTNAFADIEGWASISEEQLLSRDPDFIVTTTMYYGEGPTPVEEILSRDGWDSLKAVQNGQVFNADSDSITRPGPRLTDAALALYQFILDSEAEVPAA